MATLPLCGDIAAARAFAAQAAAVRRAGCPRRGRRIDEDPANDIRCDDACRPQARARRAAGRAAANLVPLAAIGLVCAAATAAPPPDPPRHAPSHRRAPTHPPAELRPPAWHGDIARFHEHDWQLWRNGRWLHQRHDGRLGWWWVVGSVWYFYPAPVYPCPEPWAPSSWVPSVPPARFWYFCEASGSFYPYVANCPGGWKQVPALMDEAAASAASR